MKRYLLFIMLIGLGSPVFAEAPADDGALRRAVEQLRSAVGSWEVVTSYLNEDSTVAQTVTGTYEFSWVVADRVVSGKSEIAELKQSAGILFYINEAKQQIEMASVGGDGRLWIMTGPMGGEERFSQEFKTAGGRTAQLRFTRFNVSPDAFESRMEYTEDAGKTWKRGNHQSFQRATP